MHRNQRSDEGDGRLPVSEAYNYEHFPRDLDGASFAAFRNGLRVGEPAPDGEATRLEAGARVRLSEYWCACPVIIEFGSVT